MVEGDAPARFVRLPPPGDEDVEGILTRVIRRVREKLPDLEDELDTQDPDDPLASLQAAEADRRSVSTDPFKHSRRSALLDGFSLHAGVQVREHDRQGLERLCRYAARPPLALHRLSLAPNGRLVYRMKRPRGGSLFLVLTPQELIAKLATLVPPPRAHALRYHGVFAPHSRSRPSVVPVGEAPQAPCVAPPTPPAPPIPLDHLGLDSQAPPVKKVGPAAPDDAEPGPEYDQVDPRYDD